MHESEEREKIREKVEERRKGHFMVRQGSKPCSPRETVPTIPGVLTSRGCTFAGARGVVFGPITDVANIVHGPIGCSYYTWDQRRNLGLDSSFLKRCFCTDMKEKDIIFGGEKKLYNTILQVHALYKPAAIAVYATCPVGLIGDDIDAVCKKAQKEIGIQVIAVHSEGFKGVNQSNGHKVACDTLVRHVVGTVEPDTVTDFDVNIVGEYNIGGDGWEHKRIFTRLGLRVVCIWTGDSTFRQLQSCHRVKLNLIHCQRSITSLAEDMMAMYGTPMMNFSMFGIAQTTESLRRIGAFFGLEKKAEEIIEEEYSAVREEIERYREKFRGKRVLIYIGGSRAWHFISMFEELGLEVMVSGTEFGHADDYEKLWFKSKEGVTFVDDLNHYEMCDLIEKFKLDLVCSGIKEQPTARSRDIPYMNIHSYTGAGPFIGFRGLVQVAHEVDKAMSIEDIDINTPFWEREKGRP